MIKCLSRLFSKSHICIIFTLLVVSLAISVPETDKPDDSNEPSGLLNGCSNEIAFKCFIGPEDCPGVKQFADPYVFKENGSFYITSTYDADFPVYMFETVDFVHKKRHVLNLDLNPSYLRSYFNKPSLTARNVWGLVPYKHKDNHWHAYGSIHIGGYKTFICHFSPIGDAAWPVTDWKLDKVLIGSPSNSAYETKIYSDSDGIYIIYCKNLPDGNNHIMAQKMLDPAAIDTSFSPKALLSPEDLMSEYRNPPRGMKICEGANISHIVTPNGSKYVMLYSVGDFALQNYKLGASYSDTLMPSGQKQYVKPKKYDAENIWMNSRPEKEVVYLLQTQKARWPNCYGRYFNGPGVGNIVEYCSNHYLVFHARKPGNTGSGAGRWVWMCPVKIDFSLEMHSWLTPLIPDRHESKQH